MAALMALVLAATALGGCTLPPDVAYTYSVVGWGSTADLGEFAQQANETLNDPAGWAAGGAIGFVQVAEGGDFTLYLAAPGNVASLSPVCSVDWSCTVGGSVAINDVRWLTGSPAWNGAGGSLRDYRHMVVNHEVGHWLGFGHVNCPGPGQPAPVMQQQSKDLQGCAFNPWPLAGERERAAAARGTAVRSGDPVGFLDNVDRVPGGIHVQGWAIDPDTSVRVVVHVYLDGVPTVALAAAVSRPDVGDAYPFYGPDHGYETVIAADGAPHTVCVYAINQFRSGGNVLLGCRGV
jgi:hypothetical protein